jgi:hypothetical protein
MSRVLQFRNYGVYVNDERGAQHHNPHAHVKNRRKRIASIFLVTLTVYDEVESVPSELLDLIGERILDLIAEWEKLNP